MKPIIKREDPGKGLSADMFKKDQRFKDSEGDERGRGFAAEEGALAAMSTVTSERSTMPQLTSFEFRCWRRRRNS